MKKLMKTWLKVIGVASIGVLILTALGIFIIVKFDSDGWNSVLLSVAQGFLYTGIGALIVVLTTLINKNWKKIKRIFA